MGMKIKNAPLIIVMRLVCMDVDEQGDENLKFKSKKSKEQMGSKGLKGSMSSEENYACRVVDFCLWV